MTDCLIGDSGFVGSSLRRQRAFDAGFNSKTIEQAAGDYSLVVCAGAPAQKWIAERDPDADLANLKRLGAALGRIEAERFVLISTVDVFADSRGADEQTPATEAGLGAYGRNRLWLEGLVRDRFPSALVVRLPGLVGPGLRKNAIFDLLNDNNLHAVDSRAVYQFYPMVNLWSDLAAALEAGLRLVHFAAEPVSISEVASQGFGRSFENSLDRPPAAYDLRTRHAEALGAGGSGYLYSKRETLMAIRAYAQSEPRSI